MHLPMTQLSSNDNLTALNSLVIHSWNSNFRKRFPERLFYSLFDCLLFTKETFTGLNLKTNNAQDTVFPRCFFHVEAVVVSIILT